MPPIIFDLDGTLLDTLADIAVAADRALTDLGQPTHTDEAYRYMVGYGSDVLMRRALPEDRRDLAERALELFKTHYYRHLNERTTIYPGIAELLDELTARGTPMAILSNKPHPATLDCAAGMLGRWTWAAAAGHRDGVPKKPDAAPALQIAEELGVPPRRCLFVGDTEVDMLTARNAGMTPIGVLWGFRDRSDLTDHGAAHLIESPRQLLDL